MPIQDFIFFLTDLKPETSQEVYFCSTIKACSFSEGPQRGSVTHNERSD